MMKSIASVIGAYALSIILVLATDLLLSRLFPGDFERGHVPSDTALMTSTALFIVISILCAWICARLAPNRAGRHVFWFFVIGEVMGIAATIPNWSKDWPHWYWLSWLFSWPVSCWLGLLLSARPGTAHPSRAGSGQSRAS
ncbi:MAG TPA: hypothetical protein VKB79_12120 [Bryobacteraceae bacterium]|nr:hypothetical protein [Bryobacteraceae bacterium]